MVLGGSLGVVLAGCDSQSAVSLGPPPQQTTAAGSGALPASTSFEVWFARGGRLAPELRTHATTRRVATSALEALLAGPTRAERSSGITTAVPAGTRLLGISIKNGVAIADLTSEYQSGGGSLSMQVRLGQVVYTLTQFPTVKKVRFQLDGAPVNVFSSEGIVLAHPVGRSDYEGLSPFGAQVAGTWRLLPAAPIALAAGELTSVWTGREMIVFGRATSRSSNGTLRFVNVAAAYNPGANTWRRLAPPLGLPGSYQGHYRAVWTGKEMLVWGPTVNEAFNPLTNHWRRRPRSPTGRAGGIVVWTGREMIGWGGGCCGDAFSDGAAYSPATNTWRRLAPSPVAGQQSPVGAWTGRELVIFGGRGFEGKATSGAAYDPTADSWRRIAPPPAPRYGANAVWDGREVLLAGGGVAGAEQLPAVGLAYNPTANRWRQLPPMESGRFSAAAVWTGKRLLVWGGGTGRAGSLVIPPHGLAYDPKANRWSPLPQAPLLGRLDPTAVWTGRAIIVWGGSPSGPGKPFADGAVFNPTTP
ncbi:MAG: GerMN domain-containing protein [Gaiellaceae bacterium]